ncbi:EipB family protein [Nisaea sp.]|uniref:EipB family protein n=1 Tax=Nisaea sp. TaxID=2024842 RepID=UPI003B517E5D
MDAVLKKAFALGTVLAGLVLPIAGAEAGAADRLVPHKALYKLSLKSTASNTEIVGVGGQMSFEWRDECDGWAINQRNLMILQSAEGGVRSVDSLMSTWEAKDGSSFRFIVKKEFDGNGGEIIEGRAVRAGDGSVVAAFSEPENKTMDLPAEVLFPSQHTFLLLDRIAAGAKFFSAPLFDGSEFEPASFVSAAIGRKKSAEGEKDPLISGAYWPVRLAFYGPESSEETPDYELSVDLLANGIARRLEIHFKDFAVDVTLQRLERLAATGC